MSDPVANLKPTEKLPPASKKGSVLYSKAAEAGYLRPFYQSKKSRGVKDNRSDSKKKVGDQDEGNALHNEKIKDPKTQYHIAEDRNATTTGTNKNVEKTIQGLTSDDTDKPASDNNPGDNQDADNPGGNQDADNPGDNQDADNPDDNQDADNPDDNQDTDNPGGNQDTDNPGDNQDTDNPGDNQDADNPGDNQDADNPGDNAKQQKQTNDSANTIKSPKGKSLPTEEASKKNTAETPQPRGRSEASNDSSGPGIAWTPDSPPQEFVKNIHVTMTRFIDELRKVKADLQQQFRILAELAESSGNQHTRAKDSPPDDAIGWSLFDNWD